jgi:hypothetical protein
MHPECTPAKLSAPKCARDGVMSWTRFAGRCPVASPQIPERHHALIIDDNAEVLLEKINSYGHKLINKWTDRVQRTGLC